MPVADEEREDAPVEETELRLDELLNADDVAEVGESSAEIWGYDGR